MVESGFAMTEVLNASQLVLLRRIAAAGYVRIVTAGEKTTLDELVARKLILGNQLTEAGWRELRKFRGSLEGLIPFAAPSSRSKADS